MAFDNRPNLNCKQFEQKGCDYLYLAGNNCICSGGTISSNSGYRISGTTVFNSGRVLSSLQIGCNAISSGVGSIVVGSGGMASGVTSISIGCSTKACGESSISIGTLSESRGKNSISIGYSGTIGEYSIAIGNALSCGNNSLSIGRNIVSVANCSITIGSYVTNVSGCSFALGWYDGTTGNHAPSILLSNDRSFVYGHGDPKFGIGVCNPTARLHIRSTSTSGFRLDDGYQGNGKVLTSDCNGNGRWCSLSTSYNYINGLNLCNCNVSLGGELTGETIITSTSNSYAVSFCCGARINSQRGYEISGNTIFSTSSNSISSIHIGLCSGLNDIGLCNVIIGQEAMSCNVSGNTNVAIGYRAGYTNTNSNRLYIANNQADTLIYGEFDNRKVCIGGDFYVVRDAYAGNNMYANNFVLTSDCRCKTDITPINLELPNIEYKEFKLKSYPNQLRYGVIAQEILSDYPELVRIDDNGIMSVSYIDLLIKEVAYLKYKISELEKLIL